MVMSDITARNPTKKSDSRRMELLIPSLLLSAVKNHRGRKKRKRMTLGLAATTRPNRIPEMKKEEGFLFSPGRRDAMKARDKKITRVGASSVPV
jgi:hypothetical protein